MSNYPPGVTGNEWQIAGPQWSGVLQRECGYEHEDDNGIRICAFTGEVDAERYDFEIVWTCPACGHEHTEDQDGES